MSLTTNYSGCCLNCSSSPCGGWCDECHCHECDYYVRDTENSGHCDSEQGWIDNGPDEDDEYNDPREFLSPSCLGCKHHRWEPPKNGYFKPYCSQSSDGYTNSCEELGK